MGRHKYQGKYAKHRRTRYSWVSSLLILLLVIATSTGGVVAYLSTKTGEISNNFSADAPTDPTIVETFNNLKKENVKVNVGNPGYAVYVRAAVVVTWKNAEGGDILGTVPKAGTDYEISYNTSDWFLGSDGFYYHKEMVDGTVDESNLTKTLITSCAPKEEAPKADYELNVEIIAQTIQALGETDGESPIPAVEDAWKVVTVGADLKLKEKA